MPGCEDHACVLDVIMSEVELPRGQWAEALCSLTYICIDHGAK